MIGLRISITTFGNFINPNVPTLDTNEHTMWSEEYRIDGNVSEDYFADPDSTDDGTLFDGKRPRMADFFPHAAQSDQGALSCPRYKRPREMSALDELRELDYVHTIELWAGQARFTAAIKAMGGMGVAVGFRTGCDLEDPTVRAELYKEIIRIKPNHVHASPECKTHAGFSSLNTRMYANVAEEYANKQIEQTPSLIFMADVGKLQITQDRGFSFEQPQTSKMLYAASVQEIRHVAGTNGTKIGTTICHQCAYGLEDPETKRPIYKPTTWWSNNKHFLAKVSKKCVCTQTHQRLEGNISINGIPTCRTTWAENYPEELSQAMAAGVMEEPPPTIVDLLRTPINKQASETLDYQRTNTQNNGHNYKCNTTPTTLDSQRKYNQRTTKEDEKNNWKHSMALEHGIHIRLIQGDGHCKYRSIQQGANITDSIAVMRNKVSEYIQQHSDQFNPESIPASQWKAYLHKIKGHEWGDHKTSTAMGYIYQLTIHVHTSPTQKVTPIAEGNTIVNVWYSGQTDNGHYDLVLQHPTLTPFRHIKKGNTKMISTFQPHIDTTDLDTYATLIYAVDNQRYEDINRTQHTLMIRMLTVGCMLADQLRMWQDYLERRLKPLINRDVFALPRQVHIRLTAWLVRLSWWTQYKEHLNTFFRAYEHRMHHRGAHQITLSKRETASTSNWINYQNGYHQYMLMHTGITTKTKHQHLKPKTKPSLTPSTS